MQAIEVSKLKLTTLNFLGLAIAFVPFLFYVNTLNPSLPAGDSPELATASYLLGIPHNSGYPLYTLLGKLATLIPLGNIAFRLNLASAIYVYTALGCLFYILNAVTSDVGVKAFSVLIFAFAPSIWEQAIQAEVYALHLLFISLVLLLFYLLYERNDKRFPLIFAFVTGLSFSNHLQSFIIIFPIILIMLLKYKEKRPTLNDVLMCLALFMMGLSLYLYLPLRSQNNPFLDWGNPENMKNFLYQISAVEHRSERIALMGWDIFLKRGKEILKVLYEQYGLLFPVMGVGLALQCWRGVRSRELIVLSLAIILDGFYTIFLNRVPFSVTPFNLTTLFILALALALSLKNIKEALTAKMVKVPLSATSMAIVLCLLPIIPLSKHYQHLNYKENFILYDHGHNVMKTIPEKSFLFTMGDNSLFPLWYLTAVERNRSDILLLERMLLDREWYWDQLATQNPDLNLFSIKPEVNRKGEDSFLKLLDYLVSACELHPYSLFSWPENWDERKRVQLLGLVFQIYDQSVKKEGILQTLEDKKGLSRWDNYSLRGIFDGTVPLDPMTAEILVKRYAYFIFKASELYERIGEKEKAIQYLRKSLYLRDLKTVE